MFIYNVTVSIDKDIEEDWLSWMKMIHAPEVLETGYFTDFAIFKVLLSHDDESLTYSIQYRFQNLKDLQLYQAKHAAALQQKHAERYKDKSTAFRTVLEKVS